ncbi:MAG: Omp28-related outer membrane protein, partial [Bacteroidota bacterium]|nr:Omp28-related outer membrane protein [Bacteroidota bacterium]
YIPNAGWNVWTAEMAARAQGVSPVHVDVATTVNNSTRVLNVTIDASFTYSLTGPFIVNVYLAENNVSGPQANAPANYIHHGVMRALLGGGSGTAGVIPNNPVIGTSYSHTYTYTIPNELVIGNLYVVGVVEHQPGNGGYALNSISSLHTVVGVNELHADNDRIEFFPNPFSQEVNVRVNGMTGQAELELIGLDGRVVLQRKINLIEDGVSSFSIDRHLSPGSYLLRISNGSTSLVKQVLHVTH